MGKREDGKKTIQMLNDVLLGIRRRVKHDLYVIFSSNERNVSCVYFHLTRNLL